MTKKILLYFMFVIASICLTQKVYARENFETTYTFDIPETTILDNSYDANYTYKELFDYLLALDDSNSDYTILSITFLPNASNTSIVALNVYYTLKDKLSLYNNVIPTDVYTQSQVLNFGNGFSSSSYDIYYFDITYDITNIVNCISNNSGCSSYDGAKAYMGFINTSGLPSNSSRNDNSYVLTIGEGSQFIYDTKMPMVFTHNFNNTSRYYKNLIINGNTYTIGDTLPTYKSLYYSSPTPDPDDPTPDPVPDDDLDIKDSIYWFTDNSDVLGVLTNIYILLFLYCITILIFKVYDKIKAHLTKYRRF